MKIFRFDNKATEASLDIYCGTQNVADRILKLLVKNPKDWKLSKTFIPGE